MPYFLNISIDLSFELYDDGYIREVICAVHKEDTWLIKFDSLLSVETYEVGR